MARLERFTLAAATLLLVAPAYAADPAPGTPEFAFHVLAKIDDLYRGEQSHGVMEMEVQTKNWHRSMAIESWSKGKDYSLMRILEPKKEKGTATLKDKHDLFTYLSKTGRTIKISGGMMGGSWMGSHFTNDDLVRETRLSDDYDAKQLPSEKVDGQDTYRFELTPRPNRPVVWGKVEVVLRAADLQPLTQKFFNEEGKPVRSMELSGIKQLGSRTIPTTMTMRPLDKPEEFTKVTWRELDYDVKLEDSFFSVGNLTSR